MKRFIFYIISTILILGALGYFLWNRYSMSIDKILNGLKVSLKYQVVGGFIAIFVIELFINIIIISRSMSKSIAFSFYGRPIEFHGEVINTYDYGRITFRNKMNELEAFNIYTTKSIDIPQKKALYCIGVSKNGTVKTMYEIDEYKEKAGYEYVRYHNYITSLIMLFMISLLPILGIVIVAIKTKRMR